MLGMDYVGLAAVIAAVGVAAGQIATAWLSLRNGRKIDGVHAQVQTSNGHTLGEIVEANDLRTHPDTTPAPEGP